MKSTRGQEEMVGFAVIIVIVAIIFLVLLSSYIRKPNSDLLEDAQVNSFIQATFQYTTNCETDSGNLTVQKLITQCQTKTVCMRSIEPCKLLNNTLKGIIEESWNVGTITQGYTLLIFDEEEQFLNLTGGVVSNNYNYRSSQQLLPSRDNPLTVVFTAYTKD